MFDNISVTESRPRGFHLFSEVQGFFLFGQSKIISICANLTLDSIFFR